MTIRAQELEKQLQSARDGRLGLLQHDDEMTQQVARLKEENARLKTQTIDEKAIREKVESEWSEKLQTIVSHIASDHESDLGKAIEEREAARAETRNMAIKLNALQQKLDADRQSFATTQEKMNNIRDELQSQLREAEMQLAALRAPQTEEAPFPESIAEPESEEEQRARANVLEFAEQAQAAIQRITTPEERKARILFVHHDPALRALWRDNLGKSGFDVQTAADGLEGLRLAKADKPDVVIADASMPKMDGRELCRLIKSNEDTAAVKVILITGMYTTEAPVDSVEADELLRKPVKLEAMKTALSNLLTAKV
jgi:CheY-like chemotaxis protein